MATSKVCLSAVSVVAVVLSQISVGCAHHTAASEGPTPLPQTDNGYGSIACQQRLRQASTPTCDLDPKATTTLAFLNADVADVRKSVRSSESQLVAMTALLSVVHNKVSTLLEEYGGKPSLEDVVADLRAKLSAFVEEQISAGRQVQEDNKQAIGGLSNRTSDLEARVNQLEAHLTAVAGQFNQTVDRLESENAALQTKVSDLEVEISAKRCETGSLPFTPNDEDSVTNSNGGITRTDRRRVDFSQSFSSVPKVSASFSSLDAAHNVNLRVSAKVGNVTSSGFDLAVTEWANSVNHGARVAWIACSL